MRILVTGGAGFIGSHLVDRLLTDGHDVVVIDDCSTGREENLSRWLEAGHPRLRFLRASMLDETVLASAMPSMDLCYHLAAAVGVAHVVEDPLWAILTNTRGTELVLQHAAAHKVRVVFASTSEIYGESDQIPFREDGPRVLGPTWIARWSYSSSKAVDEHLCFAYAQRGLDVAIVRYFNVFGRRLDPKGYGSVIARFLSQALAGQPLTVHGDGKQSRCFTHVSEAVEATVRAATLPQALGEVVNVGSAFETTINDLARTVLDVSGSQGSIEHISYDEAYGKGFADTRRRVPDVSKAERLLGWRAEIELREGLRDLLAERRHVGSEG